VDLAAFADDGEGAITAFEAEAFDVGGFGDAQAVEGEQRDERVVAGVAESGGDEHAPDFVQR